MNSKESINGGKSQEEILGAESNINFDKVRTKLTKIARTNERGLQKLTIKNSRASTTLVKEDNTKVNSNGNTEASTTAP